MIDILLGVIGCYGVAAAAVHMASYVMAKVPRADKHYILMTRNDELRLEGCIRSLHRFSKLTGTSVRITVWDRGSTDDTAFIATRFGDGIRLVTVSDMDSGVMHERTEEQPEADSASSRMEIVKREASELGAGWTGSEAGEPGAAWTGSEADDLGGDWTGSDAGELGAVWTESGGAADSSKRQSLGDSGKGGRDRLLWSLRSHGIVREQDQPVLVDLDLPEDWFKLPF
ncbi:MULTISPECIES: hypothetical protein [unclassified Paenibacillus]|uniref:hypothetical protein n=1 Tax=unclassified Paenibacillus TaxID=185978 RepID=UPI0009574AA2|nr:MULTISPECIES: hypothetical protein [unclassified Paenibacillus]ASS67243.1 hypothetical protein CIC07_14660 [Paenibacillus sp. RUD330]SIQ84440.1 hypothetical protein SAMN05880555_2496 [Paenibacillus sp. RU4X]SIR05308.1 hypothetical protein SAMN05880570_2495 [Paenibacillus sp. RU4T]